MLLGRSLESTRQRPVLCPPCSRRPLTRERRVRAEDPHGPRSRRPGEGAAGGLCVAASGGGKAVGWAEAGPGGEDAVLLGLVGPSHPAGSRHAGTAMQAEAVKQDLRMLRERLAQCSADSQKHKELLQCLVGVEWSPCPRGLGLRDPSP